MKTADTCLNCAILTCQIRENCPDNETATQSQTMQPTLKEHTQP